MAVAAGKLLRLDANSDGDCAWRCQFAGLWLMKSARSGTGAMVKRLHLGRAAESGVLAASLAADGLTGTRTPRGDAGFMKLSARMGCRRSDSSRLGSEFATPNLCLKPFRAHDGADRSAGNPRSCGPSTRFNGAQVDRVTVAGNERMATVNIC